MNSSYGNMMASWTTQQQQFWGYVDAQGSIIAQDAVQGTRAIGVTLEKFNQLEQLANEAASKAEEYKNRLIEAGLIVIPPTPEEQIAALTAQVEKLTAIITENQKDGVSHGHNGHSEVDTTPGQPVDTKSGAGASDGGAVLPKSTGSRPATNSVRKNQN